MLGPRQSGKTTLIRAAFPKKTYLNREEAENRAFATLDPKGFMKAYPEGTILDEVQRTPHLLSYIQVQVDEKDQKGSFILTGIHQPEFHSDDFTIFSRKNLYLTAFTVEFTRDPKSPYRRYHTFIEMSLAKK